MSEPSISVIIYAYNEEKNIQEAIRSARLLTGTVLVIDSDSNDKTAQIAKRNDVLIYSFPHVSYVEPVREFGIRKAETDWVFILDADERMTEELAHEIRKRIQNVSVSSYRVPRKNIFGQTKWLKHGGWWPDYQIRLVKKKFFISWPKEIHSTPLIAGETGFLQEPLVHFFHGDFEGMVVKTMVFEERESDLLMRGKRNAATPIFFRKFFGELYRRSVKNLGFLDGEIGIIESIYQAFSKTITYLFLYEKKKSGTL